MVLLTNAFNHRNVSCKYFNGNIDLVWILLSSWRFKYGLNNVPKVPPTLLINNNPLGNELTFSIFTKFSKKRVENPINDRNIFMWFLIMWAKANLARLNCIQDFIVHCSVVYSVKFIFERWNLNEWIVEGSTVKATTHFELRHTNNNEIFIIFAHLLWHTRDSKFNIFMFLAFHLKRRIIVLWRILSHIKCG